MRRRVFLAWHLLFKQKSRLAVAMAGIAFANMLMFMQLGFRGALFESNCRPQKALDADLVVLNGRFESLHAPQSFARDKLLLCASHAAVREVISLSYGFAEWRNPVTHGYRLLLVFGIEPEHPPFRAMAQTQSWNDLMTFGHVWFDRASRAEFGPIPRLMAADGQVEGEVSKRRVTVTGLFTLGANFAADGNLIASRSTFLQMIPTHSPDKIEVGLIRLREGADARAVAADLQRRLGTSEIVVTREKFAQIEKDYWQRSTSIGFIFGLGVAIGFVVGIVIVYQVLSSDVSDHLAEYATLKAMGYSNRYLVGVFAQESVLLAVLGFLPGIGIAMVLYHRAAAATTLPIAMDAERAIGVFVATLVMCFISGLVAASKLRYADPADIF
ncbi:MAG: FtsX-like permease family protein [Proteobacteria bacterium]|nr:FtsX-like permease family protein [Pseudomonadota bacterium]